MLCPALIIRLTIEDQAPSVYVIAQNEEEQERLLDWVRSQHNLHDLAERALEVRDAARDA